MQGDKSTDTFQNVAPTPQNYSPFAHTSVAPPASTPRRFSALWVGIGLAVLLLAGGVTWAIRGLAADPYRTLEVFPLETYLGNYHALEGSHFKATLRVENDLGYSPGVGRLMVFSVEGDGRTLAALIPARLATTLFNRGQVYTAELQVEQGGIIQVNRYAKN